MWHRRLAVLSLVACATVIAVASAAGPGGWDRLGDGGTAGSGSLNGAVRALNSDVAGVLYVGGAFTDAGGIADADRIAVWNGSAWSSLGPSSLNGDVMAIATHEGRVFAGGTFTNAGGAAEADHLAVWNGASWSPFCDATGAAFAGNVTALQIVGSTLYVGGSFLNAAGIAAADGLLACDLESGAASAPVAAATDMSGGVYALAADNAGVLYAGGTFINQGGDPAADYVAAWNGQTWSSIGTGASPGGGAVTGIVRSLTARGSDVYVGADAVDIALIAEADHVARWNGASWSALGANAAGDDGWFPASAFINGMTTFGANVFAIGSFQNAGGDSRADVIAFFDGSEWRPVGSNAAGDGPLNASGHVVSVLGQSLYAGGSFTSAGGDSLARFAAGFPLAQIIAQATPTPTPSPQPTSAPTPTVTAAPNPQPTPTATPAPLPPPVLGASFHAVVDAGTVLVALPAAGRAGSASAATAKFIPLTEARHLPVGTTFDTTRGSVRLTFAAKRAGRTERGAFAGARFRTAQSRRDGLTTLTVTGGRRIACGAKRVLTSRATGRFRTRGRRSWTTGRGASWTQTDSCRGTLTAVRAGRVVVRDFAKRRDFAVKRGRRHLAR